jgi:E3 ubiquitin-protein ligase EDD1
MLEGKKKTIILRNEYFIFFMFRLIGLCLLQNELFPLPLCRHVIKYILNRQIRWHDLAFFDSTMYENLRRTAYDAEKNGAQYIHDLHLTFSMTVSEKEVR